jgi:hypothetical protein
VGAHPLALLAALTVLAAPATAQIIPTGTPAADILLSQAIAEQRIFLTCSALDPALHWYVTDSWLRDVEAASDLLTANQVPPEAIAAFQAAADIDTLLPPPDMPFQEVVQLCDTNRGWAERFADGDFLLLASALPEVLP